MDILLIIPLVAAFIAVLILSPMWIRKAHQIGLIWDDMNKIKAPKVAGSGGVIVLVGFLFGLLIYIAYRIFIVGSSDFLVLMFALLNVVLLAAGVGLVDDLFGWQRGGLSRRSRLLMILFACIPLMVVNAGQNTMNFPFFGDVQLGIFYALFIIPLGIVGATTTFNFLAGFNGLEAGNGVILISGLSIVSALTGNSWPAIVGLSMVFALLAFLKFNFVPAKVFPGDVLTYSVGSLIAVMAILGNFERIAVFFFLPCIIETILKTRGGLVKQSFGLPQKDGSLGLRYPKIYGLTHLSIWIMQKFGVKPTEKRVVLSIWTFQALVIVLGIFIFREGIFNA